MRKTIATLAVSFAALISQPAWADRYFFEGVYTGGTGNITVDDTEVEFEQAAVDLTVNFGSISTYNIPYNEASFLNRSSFINYRQNSLGNDDTEELISHEVSGRFVLRSGLYIAAIGDIDRDNRDNNVYEIQLGQFTTDYTSVFAGYIVDNQDSANVFTAGVHFTSPSGKGNTWTAYDFGGRYLVEGEDSEYALNFGIAYYPGFRSALGFLYEYADGRLTDSHETNVYGEYYFSKYISTRIDGTVLRLADIEERSASFSVKLRF